MALIEMRYVGAHLLYTLNHHPIYFADVGAKQIALFKPAGKILRNIGVGVEEIGVYPKITEGFQPRKLMDFSKGRADDQDGLDFSPARRRHS